MSFAESHLGLLDSVVCSAEVLCEGERYCLGTKLCLLHKICHRVDHHKNEYLNHLLQLLTQ